MTQIVAQFWAPYRGSKNVFYDPRPGETADRVAANIVNQAVAKFNSAWPGCRKEELKIVGVGDGYRNLDRTTAPELFG